jgi:transglutaminase-like putative cysteine protease
MRFAIRYLTEYRYREPVSDNLNALRVCPASTATQRCEQFEVRVDPGARLGRHVDYFGTDVTEFAIHQPHRQLTIDARAQVLTDAAPPPPERLWAELASPAYREPAAEFLLPAIDQPPADALAELLAATRSASPLACLLQTCEAIPDRFEYRRGATYVASTVTDLLAAGAGVCQDFVHLGLVLLRAHGIAARYVSGYLFAAPEGNGQDSVEVDTHAWIEALLPTDGEPVWVGVDPTNRGLSGEQHVKIGHGRHYADVPPIRGVYRGHAHAELELSVRMTKTAR